MLTVILGLQNYKRNGLDFSTLSLQYSYYELRNFKYEARIFVSHTLDLQSYLKRGLCFALTEGWNSNDSREIGVTAEPSITGPWHSFEHLQAIVRA